MSDAEEKARLIQEMGSRDNQIALAAVKMLRERRWLYDGSLRGVHLQEANLREVNLAFAKMSEADLFGVDLGDSNLTSSNLEWAFLAEANLNDVDLQYSFLADADLSDARLISANLDRTDLSRANLQGVDLGSAIFRDTVLVETDLSQAYCYNTSFINVDLSKVKGLATVRHRGPSHIDTHTFHKSGGNIPEVFLRGCGVSDEFIEFTRGLFGKAIEFYSCFIGYSHTDKAFARRLHDTLQGRGVRCWLDEKDMKPGDPIRESINQGIRLHDKFLLCCSKTSLHSGWVEEELSHLFEKEGETGRLALIPLNMDGYLFNGYQGGYGAKIRARLAADFTGWESDNAKFEAEFERVLAALKSQSLPTEG